jgi:uncharacterized protein (TIGR02147 family)
MRSIFEYTTYQKFLADFFAESKKKDPKFSHRSLAEELGISMPNLVMLVIQGKRKISANLRLQLAKAMKLHKPEALYFENMVGFMQAKTHEEKNEFFMNMLKQRRRLKMKKIEEQQYEYFSNWYNPVVRELVTHPLFKGNYKWLSKKILPRIAPEQAKASVELLLRLGLIVRKGRVYKHKEAFISTGPEVRSIALVNFHRSMAGLALGSYDRNPKSEHNITGCTINLSREHFEGLIREITDFRTKALSLADTAGNSTRVYQLNMQLFPVSKK